MFPIFSSKSFKELDKSVFETKSPENSTEAKLNKRINELEILVEELRKELQLNNSIKDNLNKEIRELTKQKNIILKRSLNLSKVKNEHLPLLKGYNSVFKAEANVACVQNCVAVHFYGDPKEGTKVKKVLNQHIAENWNYYKNKVEMPYTQTVGVGINSKDVTIHNDDEMIAFLKSEESLQLYSDSMELIAIANMFKINIKRDFDKTTR